MCVLVRMLLLVIAWIWFSSAEGRIVGYVVPIKETELDWPLCKNHLCETLNLYASNSSMLYTLDTLVFLPGYHELNLDMIVTNTSGLTLEARMTSSAERVIVTCVNEVGLTFINVQALTLQGLEIRYCGSLNYSHPYRAALHFQNVADLTLMDVRVLNSSGYGIVTKNIQGDSFIGNCTFQYNSGSSTYNGGNAIMVFSNCYQDFWANVSIFSSNFSYGNYSGYNYTYYNSTLATGLTVILSCSNINLQMNNVTMEENYNSYYRGIGGNLFIHFFSEFHFIENRVHIDASRFIGGGAQLGAGLAVTYLTNSNVSSPCKNDLIIANSEVSYNTGISGCGLYIEFLVPKVTESCPMGIIWMENTTFLNNRAKMIYFSYKYNIGVAIFILNGYVKDSLRGLNPYDIYMENVTVQESVMEQLDETESAIAVSAAIVSAKYAGNLIISNSKILDSSVTGISLFKSKLSLDGTVIIRNNSGINGGGLVLCGSSFIQLYPNADLRFVNNHADIFGGAIYSESQCKDTHPICFFQFAVVQKCAFVVKPAKMVTCYSAHVAMENNTAGVAGYDIFGGNVANCYFHRTSINYRTNSDIFYQIFNVSKNIGKVFSAVSSDPDKICSCSMKPAFQYNCTTSFNYKIPVYPGQKIFIPVVIVGQLNGTVPGSVLINSKKPYSVIYTDRCTNIPIVVKHNHTSYELKVQNTNVPKGKNIRYLLNDKVLNISVKIKNCPMGFTLGDDMCSCDNLTHSLNCNITNLTVKRGYDDWIGLLRNTKHKKLIIYHPFCPFDYCSGDSEIRVTENDILSDAQCSLHRTGLLCGACKTNFSVSLGSTMCLDCTGVPKAYPFLIIMLVSVCGLLLMGALFILEISITDGLISGLLFYANVLYSNKALFKFTTTNFFTIAISVINLDIHLNSCFYNGMDTYSRTWYQLCIPTLLWIAIALVILLSNKFDRVAKLVGRNSAKVLATLIELTFNRILQACILVFSITTINIPATDGSTKVKYVWLPDANIDYLKGKHVALFLVAAFLSLFLLAYTLVLLFVQPLMRYSHLRCFQWVNRLKPIFDAYTAPNIIRSRCRFWGGFLLLARIMLSVYIAVNVKNQQDSDFSAIILICVLVLVVPFMTGGVYKSFWLNVLNGSFFVNLIVLCTYLNKVFHLNKSFYFASHGKGHDVVHLSSGISIVIAVSVIIYYFWRKFKKCCRKLCLKRRQRSEEKSLIVCSQQHSRTLSISLNHDD